MKECELCNFPARMYCESDQACLCWDCDAKVHCANFLVARHSRSLLCHVCQSPTPWKASGAKLGPTISVCEKCVNNSNGRQERNGEDDDELEEEDYVDENEYEDEDEDDEFEEDDDGDHFDEDGENQVVPWSSTPPPPVESSSSSEESSSRLFADREAVSASAMPFSLKRQRENADLSVEDDPACSSSQLNHNARDDEATSSGSFRPLKERRRTSGTRSAHVEAESRSVALVGSMKRRFQQGMISGNDTRYLQTKQRSQSR